MTKVGRREIVLNVITKQVHMNPGGTQPMAGAVKVVRNSTTSEWVCRSQSKHVPNSEKRCRAFHGTCQDD